MSTITFEIREDGRDFWTRYTEVALETEDYETIEEMRQAAYDMVANGDVDPGDKDWGDEEVDDREHSDEDYDEDKDYDWQEPGTGTIKPHTESSIEW